MKRTQIQLPDALYARVKRFSAASELSLAEITRRGIELYLERYPEPQIESTAWKLPVVKAGKPKVALADLRSLLANTEGTRSLSSSR